jgi:hypothetical protein
MSTATLTTEHAAAIREAVRLVAQNYEDCTGGYGHETPPERFEELSRASAAFAALLRLADGEPVEITPLMLELLGNGVAEQIVCLADYPPDDEYHDTQADCVAQLWGVLEHLEGSSAATVA